MAIHSRITAELGVMQNNVNALIDMKLEKHKNLREESAFYWREISDGTLKFDRKECEVWISIWSFCKYLGCIYLWKNFQLSRNFSRKQKIASRFIAASIQKRKIILFICKTRLSDFPKNGKTTFVEKWIRKWRWNIYLHFFFKKKG